MIAKRKWTVEKVRLMVEAGRERCDRHLWAARCPRCRLGDVALEIVDFLLGEIAKQGNRRKKMMQ